MITAEKGDSRFTTYHRQLLVRIPELRHGALFLQPQHRVEIPALLLVPLHCSKTTATKGLIPPLLCRRRRGKLI